MVKNLPAMWETQVLSLGQKDLLEKELATCSSILAREIPWTEEPGELQSMGSQRVGHNWVTNIFTFHNFKIIKWLLDLENRVDPLHSQMVIRNTASTKNMMEAESSAAYSTAISPFLLDNRPLLSFRFLVSIDESWSLSQQGTIIFSFSVIVSEASLWSLSDLWDIRRCVSRASGKDFTSNKKEGLFLPYSLFSYFGSFQISRATKLLITMWWWAWRWHSIPWGG